MDKTVLPCCNLNLGKMLTHLATIFNQAKIHYWVDWGALMGILRSGELIPHDKDIDIGIFEEDICCYNSLRKEIEAKGYAFHPISLEQFQTKDNFVPRVHFKSTVKHCWPICACDIFVWKKVVKTGKHKAIMLNSDKFIYCNADYYEELETINWKGVMLKVPKNPKEYIQMRYGPTWETPDPTFFRHSRVQSV